MNIFYNGMMINSIVENDADKQKLKMKILDDNFYKYHKVMIVYDGVLSVIQAYYH